MSLTARPGRSMGIHVDTGTSTIVVQVDGPIDTSVLHRIHDAIGPLLAVRAARVELDVGGDRQVLDVA